MHADQPIDPRQQANRRLVVRLLGGVAAAFVFGFALVPLYDVVCEVTGLNGKTRSAPVAVAQTVVDTSREVSIDLLGSTMQGLSWQFSPNEARIRVHPGEIATTTFRIHNMTGVTLVGQAVPSVSPGKAAAHLQKLDCFCFQQQTLGPGESRELPVSFIVDGRLPAEVDSITLSYSFFAVEEPRQAAGRS